MDRGMVPQDNEMTLFDLWERGRTGWKALAGGLVLGIAGALAGIWLIPPKYEAVAVIEVARVAQVGPLGEAGSVSVTSQPVEAPENAIERMKAPAFQRRVAESLGDKSWLEEMQRSANGTTKELSLLLKGSLIELRIAGDSPEAAKRRAEVEVEELAKIHAELAQPTVAQLRTTLAISRDRLVSIERKWPPEQAQATRTKGDPQSLFLSWVRSTEESRSFTVRQSIVAMETALKVPATRPARAVDEIFVSTMPVSPKKALLLAVGIVAGLLGGMLRVLLRGKLAAVRDPAKRT